MGMQMRKKRRFHPHNYCGSGGVFAYLSDELSCYYSLGTSMFSFLCVYGSNIGILVAKALHAPYRKQHITENDNDAVVSCYI